jgi:ABC-2 type transport system ATP-binding protein/lipopolysaccharide transport system ATP-binding protein
VASIVVENISVIFPVYGARSRSLKNALIASTTGGRVMTDVKEHVSIEALTDFSIQINHGERIGLIGHNGAGKSTLLRVLNGIYEPQVGRVVVEGRTVPLFDMSLGTDPESTGYENILLRGMYLGFTRAEIRDKVQEIADFAGLGSFLDMPVKTYSTGMAARLTFAISTAIEPDILLIDEGIGAGDAAFLEKAKQRLEDLIERTRILILASHDEQLVRRWCSKAVLFEKGRSVNMGPVDEILAQYHTGLVS